MPADLPTRRDALKVAGALGVAALAGEAAGQVTAPATRPVADTKPTPIVGIQIGALPLTGDIDRLLDTLRTVGGINTLFVFAFGHEARFIPMAKRGFRGGNYAIPHMEFYKGSNLAYEDLRAPEFPDVDLLGQQPHAAHDRHPQAGQNRQPQNARRISCLAQRVFQPVLPRRNRLCRSGQEYRLH